MRKSLFSSILAGITILFLLSGCTGEGKDTNTSADIEVSSAETTSSNETDQSGSLLDQPVNFSTPEDVERTLQNIREKGGEKVYKKFDAALSYILTYDLSLRHDKEKMYAKLNGKTPNEIFASMKR